MRVMGIRSTPKSIIYVTLEGTLERSEVVDKGELKQAKAEGLESFYQRVSQYIQSRVEHAEVEAVGVKPIERQALRHGVKDGMVIRLQLEGIAIAAAAFGEIPVFSGNVQTITSTINASQKLQDYIDNDDFRGVIGFEELKDESKEAVLAAYFAMQKKVMIDGNR